MIHITHQPPDPRTGICIEWSAEYGYYIERDGRTICGASIGEVEDNFATAFPHLIPSYYISPSVSFHHEMLAGARRPK